jgi:hypothetical protein
MARVARSITLAMTLLAIACGRPAAIARHEPKAIESTAGENAKVFRQKKICHDLGVAYDREQHRPLPAGSLQPGDDSVDLPSQFCYSTTLTTCIWSGGDILRSSDGRNHINRRVVDLLTNRELFEYSEHPLRRLNLINSFSPEDRKREVEDMNAWNTARHQFEQRNDALLRNCAR